MVSRYQVLEDILEEIRGRKSLVATALILAPILSFLLSLLVGRYQISPQIVFSVLISKILPFHYDVPKQVEIVIIQVRLPRAIAAALVGAALALSGTSFQGLFRNPLVSSQILGVASGAGFGAALALLLSGDPVIVQVSAFGFGIVAVAISYALSRTYRETSLLTLVLAGIVVGALFSALISLIKYVADPYEKLPSITFWLMGSLSAVSFRELTWNFIPIVVPCIILVLARWRLNVLSLGEEEAKALGIDVERMRMLVISCCTLMTAAAVSIAGMVGWVGLVIPHIGRMLVGPDHKVLVPASIAIGAAYLLIVDSMVRIVSTFEMPLGVLTAIIGAPFFAYLLRKRTVSWR
ncbi:iron ABC transporter permease [Candidatus Bathyarchaeota archaeon]|nr:MAG: iron ABC transporter permease [Candidatus Bathyarchaeota archaeon]